MRLGCRISPGTLECTVTIVPHKAHVLCRQLGRELHELKPALPLFDGVTGEPRTVWNDVVLSDIHNGGLNRYTRDPLNKPVWRELTCVAHT